MGLRSIMVQLNATFSANIYNKFSYDHSPTQFDIICEQWRSRRFLQNRDIVLTQEVPQYDSIYDLYKSTMTDVETIPEAFEVLNYPSELNYYLA